MFVRKTKIMITWEKATEIADKIRSLERDKAIKLLFDLVDKDESTQPPEPDPSPLTPSGAVPVYKKPNKKGRRKKPGRKKGHPGISRTILDHIDEYKEHPLETCPHCQTPLKKPISTRKRYIEDIPQTEPEVTEHNINGCWCPKCRKIVEPVVTDAMPNDNISLHTLVLTAWLHYIGGISIIYIVPPTGGLNKLFVTL